MRAFTLMLILVFLSSVLSSSESEEKKDSKVLVLDMEKYTALKETHEWLVVKLYAPWCGHCKNMAAEWEKLPDLLGNEKVVVAEWDASADKDGAKEFSVSGFPTVVIEQLSTGKREKYSGARTAEKFAAWIKKIVNENSH